MALDIQCFTPSQRSKTWRRYILSPEIQNYNALVDRQWWGNFLQYTGHHIWCTGIDSGHHIFSPPQEYQCTSAGGILQALVLVYFTSARASNIVVFYYPLLCHRQYMACGVRSSVNNSTLGWSHMEHCQHQLLGHIQYSWTIICVTFKFDI